MLADAASASAMKSPCGSGSSFIAKTACLDMIGCLAVAY